MWAQQITENLSECSHMRSQPTYARNNINTLSKFRQNQMYVFMLFYHSNTNIREIIVIYVLN